MKAVPFQLGEELGAPAAPVEDDRGPGVVADEGPDLLRGGAQLTRQALPGGRAPHEHPLASCVGDPGVDLGRGGEAGPGQVGLLDPGAPVVGAHVAVDVEEPLGAGGRCQVVLGQGAQQLVGPAHCDQLLQAPAKGLDLGARSRPSRRPRSTGSMRVSPSARGSPSRAQNTTASTSDESE